jgi:hypothetical protein
MRNIHCPKDIGFENTFSADDCAKEQYYNNCFHCWATAKAKAIQKSWIPCNEKLPEKSGNYWCTFGGTNLAGIDYYTSESDAEKFFDEPEEFTGWQSQNVKAWMPLPEPYKAEGEE